MNSTHLLCNSFLQYIAYNFPNLQYPDNILSDILSKIPHLEDNSVQYHILPELLMCFPQDNSILANKLLLVLSILFHCNTTQDGILYIMTVV